MTVAPRHQRPAVLLPSGNAIDLADPPPTAWTDKDLAIGLLHTYRWGGHSRWPRLLTVAQHSLTVLAIRLHDEPELAPAHRLFELLHDGEEGLIGFDCIALLKAFLGAPFAALCLRLTLAIAIRYDLPELTESQYRRHKRADRIAAASEARHVTAWSPDRIADTLGRVDPALDDDPPIALVARNAYAAWEPWPAQVAADAWLHALQRERQLALAHGDGA